MRIIAGEAKGCSLKCPRTPKIRPTADKVREAVFSALQSRNIDWSCILDMYAGTGAMGIEALSRGAAEADFVEINHSCCSAITDNLNVTGFYDRAHVYRLDAMKALNILTQQYSLVFLDPPYSNKENPAIMPKLANSPLVHSGSTIVLEHYHRMEPETFYGTFQAVTTLSHGDTHVTIYQCKGGSN